MGDFFIIKTIRTSNLVRAKGIEPSSSAWEADVLPLYHARIHMLHILYKTKPNVQNKETEYFILVPYSAFLI